MGNAGEPAKIIPLRRQTPCPRCSRTSQRDAFPFCSKRCADLDLGAWLNGSYAIKSGYDSVQEETAPTEANAAGQHAIE